jgi:hypothetical protein
MLEFVASIVQLSLSAGLGGQAVLVYAAVQTLWLVLMVVGSFGLAIRPDKLTASHVAFDNAKNDNQWFKAVAYGLMTYAANNWLAIDRAAYVKWIAGDPNGTISGGIGKAMIAGHTNFIFRSLDAVLSFLDPRAGTELTSKEHEHMAEIGLNPSAVSDANWYKSSHCLRAVNPFAGRGSNQNDRRVWQ